MSYIDPAAKLYAHLPRLAMIQQGGTPAPINVEIDLSNRCSLGCQWCHFAYTHTRGPLKGKAAKPAGAVAGGDLMDLTLAKSIIDQLIDAGVDSITWTGGGEPTLHPHFAEIVSYAEGRIAQGIYTHGGHIVDRDLAPLLKRAMTFVYVSLDAASGEAYQRDKGVNRFEAVWDGVRALVNAEGQATVGVGYLITRENWRDAPVAAQLAAVMRADYIQFRPTIAYAQDTPGELAEDTGWLDLAIDCLEHLRRTIPHVEFDLQRFRDYQQWSGHGYATCWWSTLQTVITPNGKLWGCVNKREHPDAELGDLSVESFADVWARRPARPVDGSCRVMCRGHVANVELDRVFAPRPHAAFV